MESKSVQPKKEISLLLASIPMLSMALLVGVGNLWLGVDLKFILLISTLIAGIVATIVGLSVGQMIEAIAETIKKGFPAILILIAIGGVVGTWMFSGTVPYLIHTGLKLLHPDYVLVTAFIVTAAVSTFTGTSWGSAATAGVAFMGIAISMGIPLPMVAGAVISGAVFGDKVSPVSDTTNISALSAEISVYKHIRGMLPNVLISALIAIVGFTLLGLMNGGAKVENQNAIAIINDLDSMYNFNPIMLLPAVIVFAGGYKGYNPMVLMVSSSLVAILIGVFLNGFLLQDGATAMISGFNTEMISTSLGSSEGMKLIFTMVNDGTLTLLPEVQLDMIHAHKMESFRLSGLLKILLNRGGFEGMMSGAVLFTVLAIAFGAIMEASGALHKLMQFVFGGIKSSLSLVFSAFASGALLNGVTSSAMFSMLTVGQLFRESFRERNIPLSMLSRSMENSMTLLESLLPWHVTALYMFSTLGVSPTAYLPYAFFNISGILLFFVLSIRSIRKLNKAAVSS